MSRALRVAVNMQPVDEPGQAPTFHATLPMAILFEKSLDPAEIEQERNSLQEKYTELVTNLRQRRQAFKHKRALDSWLFGDAIVTFEQSTSDTLLFIDHLTEHLARDVGYGKTMIDLCRRFRLHLPNESQIDPTLSFDAYHRSGFHPERTVASTRRK